MSTNLETVRRFLRALEQGVTDAALAEFFHPDVLLREYPNRLVPAGATRDLRGILDAAERGRRVVSSQRYDIRHVVEQGENVALEVDWSAVLAVPVGTLPAGDTMRASFAVFFTFREGRILSQHNYDCFEPF